MECKLEKNWLKASEKICDAKQEYPIDMVMNLPDYCPDIQKILKCQMIPVVSQKNIMEDRVIVEGNCLIKVLYLDSEKGNIHCCESTDAFSVPVPVKQLSENFDIHVDTGVEYINCRATNSRRIDMHGALSVHTVIFNYPQKEVILSVSEDDMEQLPESVRCISASSYDVRSFVVEEILELPEGKPDAETILLSKAFAELTDVKIIPHKVIINGKLILELLYLPVSDEKNIPEYMEYEVPISQMLDCVGISDENNYDIRIRTLDCDVQIRNDFSGDTVSFDVQVRLQPEISSYYEDKIVFVRDAYSRRFPVDLKYEKAETEVLKETFTETLFEKNSFRLEKDIIRVVHVWNEMCDVETHRSINGIEYNGRYNLCILAQNEEGEILYSERMAEFTYKFDCECSDAFRTNTFSDVCSISYRMSSDEIEIKAEIVLSSTIFEKNVVTYICGIEKDDMHPLEKDTAALCIYYADKNENIWEIARRYHTSVDAITRENDLTVETLDESAVLFVPVQTE